jgi:hypothetical protein
MMLKDYFRSALLLCLALVSPALAFGYDRLYHGVGSN